MVYLTYVGWEIMKILIFETFFMCTFHVKQCKIVNECFGVFLPPKISD